MWGASLAPTVVPSRGVAPRRSVSRPFHGLRRSQDTRLRALDLAMPAAAVDVQQATSERARALVQHWARLPDHAWAACRRRAVVVHSARRAACWQSFGGQNKRAHVRHHVSRGRIGGVLGARRGLGGDSPGPWPARWHARITQRPRDGELQPELYILAVNGQFHDLVKRTKNRLRASRARSGEAPGRAQPVGNAQRARRRLAGFARGTGSGRAMG